MLAFEVGKNTIYTTSLVAANSGTPPRKKINHAMIGGTGEYSRVLGEMVLRPLSDTRYKVSWYFVD